MKFIITSFLLFITIACKAQNYPYLSKVESQNTKPSSYAIVYGEFVQRLGFSSGGFPQDIRIINQETKEIQTIRVKPAYKSAKANTFICFIKPGNYAILNYWWTKSKWYGGEMFTEPVYNNVKNASGSNQFQFSISENLVYYVGTWHFEQDQVFFSNDKLQLDQTVEKKYSRINFNTAKIILPE